jgi:hypothetical protein
LKASPSYQCGSQAELRRLDAFLNNMVVSQDCAKILVMALSSSLVIDGWKLGEKLDMFKVRRNKHVSEQRGRMMALPQKRITNNF